MNQEITIKLNLDIDEFKEKLLEIKKLLTEIKELSNISVEVK